MNSIEAFVGEKLCCCTGMKARRASQSPALSNMCCVTVNRAVVWWRQAINLAGVLQVQYHFEAVYLNGQLLLQKNASFQLQGEVNSCNISGGMAAFTL